MGSWRVDDTMRVRDHDFYTQNCANYASYRVLIYIEWGIALPFNGAEIVYVNPPRNIVVSLC